MTTNLLLKPTKLVDIACFGLIITMICVGILAYVFIPTIRTASFCEECYGGFNKPTDLIPLLIAVAILLFSLLWMGMEK